MSQQTQMIRVSQPAGAIEYTWPTTITALAGQDISTDTVEISLGGYEEPGQWEAPAVEMTLRPDNSTVTVSKLVDDSVEPGTYWVWVRITDTPEIAPRRCARLTIV